MCDPRNYGNAFDCPHYDNTIRTCIKGKNKKAKCSYVCRTYPDKDVIPWGENFKASFMGCYSKDIHNSVISTLVRSLPYPSPITGKKGSNWFDTTL